MPREIKAPLRYVTEDIPSTKRAIPSNEPQVAKVSKRGRPKVGAVITDIKSPQSSNRSVPRKSAESIVIPDEDDSDVEIIEVPKPSKRKKDEDPDWESARKAKTSRSSRSHDRVKREKTQAAVIPPTTPTQTKAVAAPVVVTTAAAAPKPLTPQKTFNIELYMECKEEPLSLAQLTAIKKEQTQYEMSQSLVKAAREGRLIFLPDGGTKILDKPMSLPPLPVPPPLIHASAPLQGMNSHIKSHNVVRSKTPDLFIVGETLPKLTSPSMHISPAMTAINKVSPSIPAPLTLVQGTYGLGIRVPTGWQMVPTTTSAGPALPSVTHPLKGAQSAPDHPKVTHVTPKTITSAKAKVQSEVLAALRQQLQQQAHAKAESEPQKKKARKHAQLEGDESGNWVPLDEYYYGKMEGDPTYQEIKGEHRFKCWYCNKMLYNNVAAMMHIQGHIDSERQVNLDLSDLTQCKHCYKQFDTPFEMQTHIEKVHMNNANVLLCRICEKNHDSRVALKEHMRKFHNACEMPYMCQLCKFRSSMYSDVVDHFKKKHNSSDAMLCMYCLRVFHVRFVNQGWGQTSIFYNHLMKHQVKNSCKKCQLCRLVFLNPGDLKTHRKMDHLPNQKGVIGMNAKYTTPDQVMIKVTEKTEVSIQAGGVKSLNVPAVKKIMEHRLSFPSNVYKVKCIECQMLMGIPDHYKKFIQCSMCRFATSCSFAYSNHMMGFHSGQMTAAASHTPDESRLEAKLYCSCSFVSSYGNRIANHLVSCSKSSCFKDPPPPSAADEFGQELQDPRKKPDASLLDVLGLIKKDSLQPLTARVPHHESPPPEPVDMPEVTLSTKLGRRPLLLRDSLKKAFKNILKEDQDKNIFEQFKFGDDSGKADKPEQGREAVDLDKHTGRELSTEEEKQASGDDVAGDGTLVCPNQNIAANTDSMQKEEIDETQGNSAASQKPAAENTAVFQEELSDHTQGKGRGTDEHATSEHPNIRKDNEQVEDNLEKKGDKTVIIMMGDQREDVILKKGTEERKYSEVSTGEDDVITSAEHFLSQSDNNNSAVPDSRSSQELINNVGFIDDEKEENNILSESIENESNSDKDIIEGGAIEIEDIGGESAMNNSIESEVSKNDGIESEVSLNDNIVGEENKNDNIESEENKNDDIESEVSLNDNIESEENKNDNIESEENKNDNIENEENKNDNIESEENKNANFENEENKNDDIESEENKNDDFESEENKNDDIESEENKNDDFENEENKNDDIESEENQNANIESEENKNANIESEENKNDDIESEENKNANIESEENKNANIESEASKNDVDIAETNNDVFGIEADKNDEIESEITKFMDTEKVKKTGSTTLDYEHEPDNFHSFMDYESGSSEVVGKQGTSEQNRCGGEETSAFADIAESMQFSTVSSVTGGGDCKLKDVTDAEFISGSDVMRLASGKQHTTKAFSETGDLRENVGDWGENLKSQESSLTLKSENVADILSTESTSSQQGCVSQEGFVTQESSGDQSAPDGSERKEAEKQSPGATHENTGPYKEVAHEEESSFLTDTRMNTVKESMSSHDQSQSSSMSSPTHIHRELSSNKDGPRSRSPDRHRDRRSRSRDRRSRSRDRERGHDRERSTNRERDRHRDHRSRSQERDHHRDRERSDRSHNKDRYRDRSRERDRHRERDRSRERDRKRDQSRERDRNRNRDYHRHKDDRRYR